MDLQFSQFSRSVVSDSLQPQGLQHTRPPCPSPTPGVYPNSCPLSRWYHSTFSSSVVPFSSCLQSFPASGSFQMSQFFTSGGQSMGASASASVLPVNIQDWFPLRWTGWISLQFKGLCLQDCIPSDESGEKYICLPFLAPQRPTTLLDSWLLSSSFKANNIAFLSDHSFITTTSSESYLSPKRLF